MKKEVWQMLKRKFEAKLEEWLKSDKILLVDGARQVGKSFLIDYFCKKYFANYVQINLALESGAIEAFRSVKDVDGFLLAVSAFSSSPLVPRETVIFIDEIQLAQGVDFLTLSKGLALDGRYRFIFSGSLLGVNDFTPRLNPTGYLYKETMYPLDFEEFLYANGVNDDVIATLESCFKERKEVPSFIHEKMIDLFYLYLLVGGMPDAVNSYLASNDLQTMRIAFKSIESFYRDDIAKYAKNEDKPYILNAYDLLPSELNSKSKRFILSKRGNGYSLKRSENDFLWMKDAGIALPVYNVDEPKIPLLLSKNSTLFKLFANDVGLLSYRLFNTGVEKKILAHAKDINFGSIFENAVAMELNTHGFKNHLFYFSSKKQGEVDFLLEYQGKVLPIEVKSGKDYKRHVALDNLLSNKEYDIEEAYIFGNCNLERKGKKTYFPIYMIDYVRQEEI